ncbi:carbohydrate binding domain-containing protein [Hamadaea sp. NPDC050747]|uniref:carbohydrate binding domain-containing protein n=1 Tax=Hamadaea sp. NPDC050747 TaxID=3155789 RepID=UPI0033E3336B
MYRRILAVAGAALLAGAAVLVASTSASAANILPNPGLESGSLSPWSCSGNLGSVVTTPVHSGSRALQGAASASDNAKCTQTVAVQANTAYTLTAWVRGGGGYVYLGVTGGNQVWNPSAASNWVQLSVAYTTGASQTSLQIYVQGWYGTGSYYADDFSLDGPGGNPSPSPTTSAPPGVPGTPGNLHVTGSTASSISLAWNASSGTVTGYRVYEGTTVRATVTGTSATVSGLGSCASHTYTVAAYNNSGESAKSGSTTGSTTGCTSTGAMAAPYYYNGWGNPPSITTVMSATGIKQFTMAFMLSGGGCTPAWDSSRPLTGGVDQQTINAVRAAGGDVEISFGGWSGNKLGPNCSSATALAAAYQQVISAYNLKYIDIDIENSDEFENEAVQDRILGALKIVKQNNPGIKTIVTFGTSTTGPTYYGTRLINQAAALGANIDVFTIMPFDFGGGADMYNNTVNAANGLKNALKTAFGWTDAQAYAHIGISGMNGYSDQSEITTTAIWTNIRNWANTNHIARLAFWSVNRDRGCAGGGVQESCSGIAQSDWAFTGITAGFTG